MADVSQIVLKDANGNTIGTYNVKDTSVPHDSKSEVSSGTALSLVTTGEKYVWNNSQKPLAYINITGNTTANYWSTSGSSYTVTSITDAFGNILSYSNLWDSSHEMLYDVYLIYKYTPSSGMQNEYTYKWKATRYLYYIATTMVRIDWEWQDTNNRYVMMTTDGMSVSFTRYPLPTNETATSGGTTLSLVTTGEKYTWNNKSNPLLVSSVSISINYGGKRYAATTTSVAKSGYTVLGTVGYQMSSIDNCVFRCDTNGNNLTVGIFTRNGVATSEIATGYVFVLYVKQ